MGDRSPHGPGVVRLPLACTADLPRVPAAESHRLLLALVACAQAEDLMFKWLKR